MAWDDLEPKTKKVVLLDLSPLSVEDLNNRIAEHEAEILRMRQAIKGKEAQRTSAAALFKGL